MRKRHKRNVHKIGTSAQPAYNYVFPKDELEARVDLCTVGCIKALEDYPRLPFPTKAEIHLDVLLHCEKMKTTMNAESLTNDYSRYADVATQYYTQSYLQNLTRYENDSDAYKADKAKYEKLGRKGLSIEVRDGIIQGLVAWRAEVYGK